MRKLAFLFVCAMFLFFPFSVYAGCGQVPHAKAAGIVPALSQLLYDSGYRTVGNRNDSPITVQYWFQERIVVRLKSGIKAKRVVFRALNMDGFPLYNDVITAPPFMTTWTQRSNEAFLITGIQVEIYPETGPPYLAGYQVDQAAVEDAYASDWANWGFYYTPICR